MVRHLRYLIVGASFFFFASVCYAAFVQMPLPVRIDDALLIHARFEHVLAIQERRP